MFLEEDSPSAQGLVPADGPRTATIAIVGEAPGREEVYKSKPFVGPSGTILSQCLHSSGMIRAEVYLTNLMKTKLPGNDASSIFHEKTGGFTEQGLEHVRKLHTELQQLPNLKVIVPVGNTAFAAVTYDPDKKAGQIGISKRRGYIFASDYFPNAIILPTMHPATVLHGNNYICRYYIAHDLKKAKTIAEQGVNLLPPKIIVPEDLLAAKEYLYYFRDEVSSFAFDIEVSNMEVSAISFCSDFEVEFESDGVNYRGWSVAIPTRDLWVEEEEVELWTAIAETLGNPRTTKIVQNGMFDISFLANRNNIIVRGPIHDTMCAQHIMYPDFLKGLEFIGSVYCYVPYWKDIVKFKNIKKES